MKNERISSKQDFYERHIQILPSHDYSNINIQSLSSNISDDKIILDSDETFNRLKFCLDKTLQNEYYKILKYQSSESFQNSYNSISNFTMHNNQSILHGSGSFREWINDMFDHNIIYNTIPIFFKDFKNDRLQVSHDPIFIYDKLFDNTNKYLLFPTYKKFYFSHPQLGNDIFIGRGVNDFNSDIHNTTKYYKFYYYHYNNGKISLIFDKNISRLDPIKETNKVIIVIQKYDNNDMENEKNLYFIKLEKIKQ